MSVRSGYCTCVHTHGTIALDKHATTDTVASQHILLLWAKLSMAYAISVVSEQLVQSRAHPGWHWNGNGYWPGVGTGSGMMLAFPSVVFSLFTWPSSRGSMPVKFGLYRPVWGPMHLKVTLVPINASVGVHPSCLLQPPTPSYRLLYIAHCPDVNYIHWRTLLIVWCED